MIKDTKGPLTEHLGELRDRLIKSFVAVGVCFVVAYFFKEQIFKLLTVPLVKAMEQTGTETKIIYTGLPEAFFTYLKVSLLAGIMVSTPVLFYQFWMFVSPGLYRNEKKYFLPIVILSVFFFLIGALFGYFIVFPYGFAFFLGFSTPEIQAMPSMKEYLGFASKMLLAFGLVFELPLILTFMARMGLVSVAFLRKNRKYAILLFFIVAAVITPPDVITQIMMAVPMMVLYEISIFGAMFFGKQQTDPLEEEEDQEEEDKDAGEDADSDTDDHEEEKGKESDG